MSTEHNNFRGADMPVVNQTEDLLTKMTDRSTDLYSIIDRLTILLRRVQGVSPQEEAKESSLAQEDPGYFKRAEMLYDTSVKQMQEIRELLSILEGYF